MLPISLAIVYRELSAERSRSAYTWW